MDLYNGVSLFGIVVLVFIARLFSKDKSIIKWEVVIWGVGLQLLFAWFIFVFPLGIKLFVWVNDVVIAVLQSASAGSKFLFGRLALSPGSVSEYGETSLGFIFAFQALPTIIFFSALTRKLHLNI